MSVALAAALAGGLYAAFPVTASNQAKAPVPAVRLEPPADAITTASIAPDPEVNDPRKGTPAFRRVLDTLIEGDPAAAFETARGLSESHERRTIQWAAIQFGSGKVPYASVLAFEDEAPDFVSASVFKTRVEQSLLRSGASNAEIIKLLGGAMPNTIDARIALAKAYREDGQTERAARIARAIWTEEFLDAKSEAKVLDALGDLITNADHWARAVHLMMNDRASGVERLIKFMTPAQKSLAVARNAVSRKAKDAKKLLDAIDPSMATHPVYIFSRVQRAVEAGLLESAAKWLDKTPKGDLPDAAEWWYERQSLVRALLAKGKPKLAYRVADGYRKGPEGRLVEAHFHAGWIALAFLKDSAAAKAHFEAMRSNATLPDSVAQANYWLGRALVRLGDNENARLAFGVAAAHGTTYYGLLARFELGLGVELRGMPNWRETETRFDKREAVRAIRLLAANGKRDWASTLLRNLTSEMTDGSELLLSAQLAQEIGSHDLAIAIADIADRRGTPLDLMSFPKYGLPTIDLAGVDLAAIYAITRQESRFNAAAVSGSGALGLMQLMPGTARETAAKIGLTYSKMRLTSDPEYNATLGATYLASQLTRYDGSLLLAAAAYNAGAGNANKWIAAYGDPREDGVDPVVWVELIPFQETRKYVQRVIGNYLVYRARLGHDELTIRDALRRIPG